MKMHHGWIVAAFAIVMLDTEAGHTQEGSCDNGRGGLMTDLGFNRLRFDTEPRISGVRSDGPAAGQLRDGDLLVALGGQPITTPEAAQRLSEIKPGEQVRLSIRRDGQVQDVTVTAGRRCIPHPPAPPEPPAPPAPPLPPMDEILPKGWLGFEITCQDCGDDESTGAFRFRAPPVVVRVGPNSPAARAGLRPGDRLTHVDGVSLTSAAGWPRWSAIQPGQEVRIAYLRGDQTHQVTISALHQPGTSRRQR